MYVKRHSTACESVAVITHPSHCNDNPPGGRGQIPSLLLLLSTPVRVPKTPVGIDNLANPLFLGVV